MSVDPDGRRCHRLSADERSGDASRSYNRIALCLLPKAGADIQHAASTSRRFMNRALARSAAYFGGSALRRSANLPGRRCKARA
jgi:hypothetical protein